MKDTAENRWARLLAKKVGRGLEDMPEVRDRANRFRRVSREHVSCVCDTFIKGGCTVNDVVGICSHWVPPRLLRRRLKYQLDKPR